MSCLAPCPACNRHIATDETACPFCATALPESFRCRPARVLPRGRLSRAAMMAAGAALVGAEACGSTSSPGPVVPLYGGSFPDAGADVRPSSSDTTPADNGAAPAPAKAP